MLVREDVVNKKDYKGWVCEFGLGLFGWLETLPCYDERGKPVELKHAVPLVYYPVEELDEIEARVRKDGFHFAHSTIHYVDGCHIPKGCEMRALVKDVA
jgi:hypothetical protein